MVQDPCGDADPAKAIEVMVRVMLRDNSIAEKVRKQLGPDPKAVKERKVGGFSPF